MAQGRVPQAWERFAVALLGKELCACVLVIAARATMIVLTAAARAVSRIPAILSAAADRGRRRWRRHRRYLVARTLVVVVAVALGATRALRYAPYCRDTPTSCVPCSVPIGAIGPFYSVELKGELALAVVMYGGHRLDEGHVDARGEHPSPTHEHNEAAQHTSARRSAAKCLGCPSLVTRTSRVASLLAVGRPP